MPKACSGKTAALFPTAVNNLRLNRDDRHDAASSLAPSLMAAARSAIR
jgi:hypothetical protein